MLQADQSCIARPCLSQKKKKKDKIFNTGQSLNIFSTPDGVAHGYNHIALERQRQEDQEFKTIFSNRCRVKLVSAT